MVKNASQNEKKSEPKPTFAESLYESMDAIAAGFIAIFILFAFVFRLVGVNGSSMVPTLADKDWLVISDFNYKPASGDIVVITQPNSLNERLVKRVVATEGEIIDINYDTGEVYVNDILLEEKYIAEPTMRKGDLEFPLAVPEGYVFVLGDNRNYSRDSRDSMIGFIDERHLLGKSLFRILPFGKFKIG